MSKEEMRRAELKVALAAAQEDTELALEGQEDEDNTFESAVAFVQEVGIRMFLYNIVKMLVVIAVIAADACACGMIPRPSASWPTPGSRPRCLGMGDGSA